MQVCIHECCVNLQACLKTFDIYCMMQVTSLIGLTASIIAVAVIDQCCCYDYHFQCCYRVRKKKMDFTSFGQQTDCVCCWCTAGLGNFTKAVGKGMGGPCFRIIQTHFASQNNVGDVAAKEQVRKPFCSTPEYELADLICTHVLYSRQKEHGTGPLYYNLYITILLFIMLTAAYLLYVIYYMLCIIYTASHA